MARLAKKPILVPKGVEVKFDGQQVTIKGPKGQLIYTIHPDISAEKENDEIRVSIKNDPSHKKIGEEAVKRNALWGTNWANINNMVIGVTKGFEKKLLLVGVGYRAQVQGNKLNLNLGFSHPTIYDTPENITIQTPSQTEIVVMGIDKQLVGQVAAEIRAIRPVEPYKGKGVRYSDERVVLKETKKK